MKSGETCLNLQSRNKNPIRESSVLFAEVAQLVEHDLAPKGNGSDLGKVFFEIIAEVAQLVEHDLAKVGVAGSSPVFRSVEEYTSFSCMI